jgi:hypothetical protein
MTVGDVVILRVPMLNEILYAVGVVFNDYGSGVQIIFEKGGLDGFSEDEQEMFLKKVGHDPATELYKFKNVIQVSADYDSGLWNFVFTHPVYNSFKS